jgi:hypothetical protein
VEQSGNRSSTCGVLSAKFCISDEVLMMHGVSLQKLFSVLLICSCWNMASNVADIRTVEEWPHTVHSFLPFWLICYHFMPFGAGGLCYGMFGGTIFYSFILPLV